MIGLEGTLRSLQIHAKFQASRTRLNFTVGLDGLCVRGKVPILTLHSLSIDTKVRIDNIHVKVNDMRKMITFNHAHSC